MKRTHNDGKNTATSDAKLKTPDGTGGDIGDEILQAKDKMNLE